MEEEEEEEEGCIKLVMHRIVMRRLFSDMIKSLHISIHHPEMEINPPKMACGCPCAGVIIITIIIKKIKIKTEKQKKKHQSHAVL